MSIIERFRKINQDRYGTYRQYKDRGHRFIGWLCTYVPEEIIEAAGFTPIRIMGGEGTTPTADAYLYSNLCSFVRSCLEEGFQQKYWFLEGIISVTACDHIRRLYDVWYRYLDTPFKHNINLPHKVTEDSLSFFRDYLEDFKQALERFTGQSISSERLREAIRLYNRTRELLRELYRLKQQSPPPLTGAETMEVILAGMILPKADYNHLLEELLVELRQQPERSAGELPRLLVSGSELDHPDYIRVIEELGCVVVIDDLCVGTRYFWDLVEEGPDPLDALACRYLSKSPCARMRPSNRRIEHLTNLIRDYGVEGIIFQLIKFCDLYSEDIPVLRERAHLKIPMLAIDREYNMAGLGQMKTRVQAFLESLGG